MTAGGGRLAWPDFARGVSIVLVVLLHLFLLHYIYFFYGSEGSEAVSAVVDFSAPLRMPLFFLVSGYLAARAVQRPWAVDARARLWTPAYLVGLWLVLNLLIDLGRERWGSGGLVDPLPFLAGNLVWPQTVLWYLYALVLFYLVTRLTRRAPASVVVGVGVLLSVIGTTWFEGLGESLLRCFVFYALAARAPELVDWIVARSRIGPLLAAAMSYTALTLLYVLTSIDFGIYLVAGVAGVVFAIQLAVRVGGHRMAAPLRYLGRHTLAIFLVHPFVFIAANDVFVQNPELAEGIRDRPWLVVAYPWVLLAVTLALCVGVEALAKRVGLGFLFALPSSWLRPLRRG